MSDEHNNTDPIERLFREKAEEYDHISYREEDWLKLEKQLDTRDMKLYYRRRLRWLVAASILILSLLGYFTFQNSNKISRLTEQLNQEDAIPQTEQPDNNQELSANQNQPDDQAEEIPELGGPDSEAGPNDENDISPILQRTNNLAILTENGSDQIEGEESIETATSIQRKPVEASRFYLEQNMDLALRDDRIQSVELAHRYWPDLNRADYFEPRKGPLASLNDDSTPQAPTSALSRLGVGFVISPDLSTVGAVSNFYDPGFKGGLLAEYSLTKNISLISGVTISNVKYKADGREYNPPQAWNYGVMPDQTTAVCVVLDIPLNLKANLFNFDRSRIFATAGLSSYIMLNEDYQFSYEGDSSDLQSSWSDRTGTRHWFSNAGFSVGLEYDLSPSWSIRAEPHIKVPLKGVGWGDVELYSIGSFVSLNYKL